MTEAEIIEAVKAGEMSQSEAARRLGRSRTYIAYRVDPEFRERQRVAHLEENMTSEQIKRRRARLLVKNMTPEQAERRAAYYRRYRAER
jgi:Helix-turn-helix domain